MTSKFLSRNGETYRVLHQDGDGCWLISFDNPTERPFRAAAAEMDSFQRIPAPQDFSSEDCNLTPAAQKRFELIQPLLEQNEAAITDRQLRLSVSKDIEEARISERVMQRAIDILAIKVPKTYSGGTYISDFEVNDAGANEAPPAQVPAELPRELTAESPEPVPRLYANQRGRKAAATETEYALTEALQRNTLCSFWTFLPRRFSPARPLR